MEIKETMGFKMRSSWKKAVNLLRDFFIYFAFAWQARLMIPYAKAFVHSFLRHLNQFRHSLYAEGIQSIHIHEEKIRKLKDVSRGLHSLLPYDSRFTYSILIPLAKPDKVLLSKSLQAALDQSPEAIEVLIGCSSQPDVVIEKVLFAYSEQYPQKIKQVQVDNTADVINQLAEKAKGNFLLILDERDWIRPDLLFRYEQTLRMCTEPEKTVLYCNLNRLTDRDCFIPQSEIAQPSALHFPLFFQQFIDKGLLIPKRLWEQVHGLQQKSRGALYEDLLLRLDQAGARFQHVPCPLYSVRSSANLSHESEKTLPAFLNALNRYTEAKQLHWKWGPGYLEHAARAIPPLNSSHSIQVIIPYKDQKELTLKCVHRLLEQKEVQFKITAVDNRSTDLSIAQEIIALGGEVMTVDEPFNYSRLNNLAVQETKTATECDILLFLNNDVELEEGALSEMLRWIDQPSVGMVGCRLNYPDGRLQHGGVRLDPCKTMAMRWEHCEKLLPFERLSAAKSLGVFDAVTAACAMIKRTLFLQVGGFDEIWYPIGYSDTNLAIKIGTLGLKSFYTPYAVGVHHESVSRKSSIEDFENSWWLHELLLANANPH